MKKKISKREVTLACICLLLISMLIYNSVTTKENAAFSDIFENSFTIIVSIISSFVATGLLPRALQEDSLNNLSDVESNLAKLLRQAKHVLPYTYDDTDDPNIDFNKKMNDSISKTDKYFYFADRALYLSKRLIKDIHEVSNRLELVVILADITEDALFTSRLHVYRQKERALMRTNETSGLRSEQIILEEEKKEVLKSLYALGKLKEKYSIDVYLHKEIPFIRYEITDDLLAMSFLTQLSSGKKYPTTLLYEEDSIFRSNFLDYTKEILSRSTLLKSEDLSAAALIELAKKAGVQNCTESEITSYYNSLIQGG